MLTDLQCRRTKPGPSRLQLADGNGLHLLILPSGHRSWRHKYRFGGQARTATYGAYPEISLEEARAMCLATRRLLRDGRDPLIERQKRSAEQAASAALTFQSFAEGWHAARKDRWNKRYADQILDRLRNHAFPTIGKLPLADVTPALVLEALRAIEANGNHEMTHRVRQHLSDIFVSGIAAGLCSTDPAAIVRKALLPTIARLRPAVRRIEDAQAVLQRTELQSAYQVTKLASRLLALTAARPGIIRLAAPAEFEGLEGPEPVWRVPAEKMKLTAERKRDASYEFVLPLSSWSVELVKAALDLAGPKAPWLFPSVRSIHKPISDSTLSGFYLGAGLRDQHVPHGWRATFSTVLNEHVARHGTENDRAVIDLMLAHIADGVEAAYNRAVYMPRRRELAQLWGDMLMQGAPDVARLLGKA